MNTRMVEFREFIKRHPLIRQDVLANKTSWQSIYEDWVILGEDDSRFDIYRESNKQHTQTKNIIPEFNNFINNDNVKTAINYVKKINPDSISKTLNNVQKVLQITQSFGTKPKGGLYNANYNSWWD
jgi:hypothetical protein